MSKDINLYQDLYANQPYEKYQAGFRKQKILEIVTQYKHDSILEIGCGLKSIFHVLDGFRKLTVLEPAQSFYEKAIADRAEFPEKNIFIYKKTLDEYAEKMENYHFDFILLSSLLHEIQNPEAMLTMLYEISSTETTIHINVPNARSFHRLLALEIGLISNVFEKSQANIQFNQFTIFDLEKLKQIVSNHGFEVVDEGSYSFKPFTHSQMQDILDKSIITDEILNGLYKMDKYLSGLGSEIFVNIKKK